MSKFNYEVRDINLAKTGIEKIEWAYRNMPVLRAIEAELIEKQPFKGLKISVSVHVEAKTACLARALARGGAEVALTGCNPLSTQDDVAAALASMDIMNIYAVHGDDEEHYWSRLKKALSFKPDIVIDDGGDFAFSFTLRCRILQQISWVAAKRPQQAFTDLRSLRMKASSFIL